MHDLPLPDASEPEPHLRMTHKEARPDSPLARGQAGKTQPDQNPVQRDRCAPPDALGAPGGVEGS